MPYLIDGHNLIAHMDAITLDNPNDEMMLVNRLIGFSNRVRKKCVVVFDKGLPSGKSPASRSLLEVHFASITSSADAVLIQRIHRAKDPQGWTLISNDQAIVRVAQRNKMKIMRAEQFARLIALPQSPYDLGEWVHVNVPASEVKEWLEIFSEHMPPDLQTTHTQGIAPPPTEAKTLPKPPTKPTTPKPPKPPKPPRRADPPRDDQPHAHPNDIEYWLKIFGE